MMQVQPASQSNRASTSDYPTVLSAMVDTLGVGKEEKMSAELLAELTGMSETVITKLRTFAGRLGGLEFRYEARNNPKPKGRGISGRNSYWTFVMSAAEMEAKAKKDWGFTALDNHNIDKRMPPDPNRRDRKAPAPSNGAVNPEPVTSVRVLGLVRVEDETQLQRELRKTRKNQAEALVEAVRQYNNRESFIQEELKRFADMGIDIDPSAIKFTPNLAFETAGPLVTLIDTLTAQNVRQAENLATRQNNVIDPEWRKQLESENTELKATLNEMHEAHKRIVNNWSHKVGRLNKRIEDLEEEIRNTATRRLAGIAAG